jgi:putative oxidoreductase
MRKRILSNSINSTLANTWLLILRLSAGGFMLTHGYPKLTRLFESGEIKFGDPLGIGPAASLVLAVFAEFICSILVGLGLFTRLATVPLIITMLVAAFIAHGEDPFSKKELALMYILVYVTLLVFGGGKYSMDELISGKKGL